MEARHTINVDWDNTAVPGMWPQKPTTFLPGFVEAMLRFRAAGHPVRIHTSRINSMNPLTGEQRPADEVTAEIQYIRSTLDAAGLTFVDVYTRPGKPGGAVYIDDKAERYNPGPKSWARLADRILLRLDGEEPIFPHVGNGTEVSA